MNERFYSNLSEVFDILVSRPESIVDDTAVERLLSWLQQCSNSEDEKLHRTCIAFWENEELWVHDTTVSYALRLAGFIGRSCSGQLKFMVENSIEALLRNTLSRDIIKEPVVKYGFYGGLKFLCEKTKWLSFVEGFTDVVVTDLSNAKCMYVRKAIEDFLAVFLNGLMKPKTKESDTLHRLSSTVEKSDALYMASFTQALIYVAEINTASAFLFITPSNFVEKALSIIVSENGCTKMLSRAVIDLIETVSRMVGADWRKLLPNQEDPRKYLQQILDDHDEVFGDLFPHFCSCLLQNNKNSSLGNDWNGVVFLRMLLPVITLQEYRKKLDEKAIPHVDHNVKAWKRRLIHVLDVTSKLEIQVYEECRSHLNAWFSYVLVILQVSMNNIGDAQLDRHLVAVINDQKVTRMCLTYLKQISIQALEEEVRAKFACTMLNIMASPSSSSQVVSSVIEVNRNFIREGGLPAFLAVDCKKSFREVVYMKLLSMDWEVKDSILSLLIEVICQSDGDDISKDFLFQDGGWCAIVLTMLKDEESFVRSKAVKLIQHVLNVKNLGCYFLRNIDMNLITLWTMLKEIFLDPYKEDDMFTRRSVLDLISSWVDSKNFTWSCEKVNLADSKVPINVNEIQPIVVNGISDFDWVTRCACADVLISVVTSASKLGRVTEVYELFTRIYDNVLRVGIKDCEFTVVERFLKCLQYLQDTKEKDICTSSSTFEEFETLISNTDKVSVDELRRLLSTWDFGQLLLDLKEMDEKIKSDPISFMDDIIISSQKADENLLDCY